MLRIKQSSVASRKSRYQHQGKLKLQRLSLLSLLSGTLILLPPWQAQADENSDNETASAFAELIQSVEYRGNLALQASAFFEESQHQGDQRTNTSLSGEVELYFPFSDGDSSLVVTPFFRLDENDSQRTHFDFREFLYQRNTDEWELRVGLGKVFWGVAESKNVVDVINQRDSVEGLTSDEKLGQPMIHFSWFRDLGSLDVFILPGFREQTFPGRNGRPRIPVVIDKDATIYESSERSNKADIAIRYSTVVDDWDLGFSFFDGTARDPLLLPQADPVQGGITLQPFYHQITQLGFDAQATLESWLWKFEGIYQRGKQIDNHVEMVAGFEYSFYSVMDTDTDVGLVAEYLYDQRDKSATQIFQNDLLLGLRLALNDEQSSEALIGSIIDVDSKASTLTLEANRRIGDSMKLSATAAIWLDTSDDPEGELLENEDYFELELAWFF